MTRLYQAAFFAIFAAISWNVVAFAWGRFAPGFVMSATIAAAITAAVIAATVPNRLFGQERWVGWAKSFGTSFGITVGTVMAAVIVQLIFFPTSGFPEIASAPSGNIMMVLFTMFIYPPALLFWLICTGGFHFWARRLRAQKVTS